MFNLFKGQQTTTEITPDATVSEPKKLKDIRPLWKARAADRKITSSDIAALCIYRALVKDQVPEGAKTRLGKAFSPIKNEVKLANGAAPYAARDIAVAYIKYSIFAEWLDADEMKLLLDAAQKTKVALK